MARIRTIKPEFWTDAKTGTLSEFAKCLFIGLLNHADDYGVIEWSPLEWRVKIFPYHSDTTTGAVNTAIVDELAPRGLLVIFSLEEDDGAHKQFGFIPNFTKHQVINKPSRPILHGWKKEDNPKTYAKRCGSAYDEIGAPRHDATTPLPEWYGSTTSWKGKEGKGKEGKGGESRGSAEGETASSARGHPDAPPSATPPPQNDFPREPEIPETRDPPPPRGPVRSQAGGEVQAIRDGDRESPHTAPPGPLPDSGTRAGANGAAPAGRGSPRGPSRSTAGTRWPGDADLPDDWLDWTIRERPGWSAADVREVYARFRDYWIAKPGKDGRKADWFATWRNWIRKESVAPLRARASPRGERGNAAVAEEAKRLFLERQIHGKEGHTIEGDYHEIH